MGKKGGADRTGLSTLHAEKHRRKTGEFDTKQTRGIRREAKEKARLKRIGKESKSRLLFYLGISAGVLLVVLLAVWGYMYLASAPPLGFDDGPVPY
mmetsp:Transcript_10741/g.30149  ORF Transcript_10741/g.30149 Transcript_10741/m.30149 type:complete len:96 (-) Transcript_10741:358-645(-)